MFSILIYLGNVFLTFTRRCELLVIVDSGVATLTSRSQKEMEDLQIFNARAKILSFIKETAAGQVWTRGFRKLEAPVLKIAFENEALEKLVCIGDNPRESDLMRDLHHSIENNKRRTAYYLGVVGYRNGLRKLNPESHVTIALAVTFCRFCGNAISDSLSTVDNICDFCVSKCEHSYMLSQFGVNPVRICRKCSRTDLQISACTRIGPKYSFKKTDKTLSSALVDHLLQKIDHQI